MESQDATTGKDLKFYLPFHFKFGKIQIQQSKRAYPNPPTWTRSVVPLVLFPLIRKPHFLMKRRKNMVVKIVEVLLRLISLLELQINLHCPFLSSPRIHGVRINSIHWRQSIACLPYSTGECSYHRTIFLYHLQALFQVEECSRSQDWSGANIETNSGCLLLFHECFIEWR